MERDRRASKKRNWTYFPLSIATWYNLTVLKKPGSGDTKQEEKKKNEMKMNLIESEKWTRLISGKTIAKENKKKENDWCLIAFAVCNKLKMIKQIKQKEKNESNVSGRLFVCFVGRAKTKKWANKHLKQRDQFLRCSYKQIWNSNGDRLSI